jgi:pimeloyl-ACP methyl ester carboxylesterase
VDNQVESEVLVVFLHGLGLDHRDFEAILKGLPYRGLSPSLYGCEPDRRERISLSLSDHIHVLREWFRAMVALHKPVTVILVGFSLGADMGFELLKAPADPPTPRVDAFLGLECNLSIDTCFVSRVLARIQPSRIDMSVGDLREFGANASTLDEWLNIHEYLVKVLRKFQDDIGAMQRAATDIVTLFQEHPGFGIFAEWFKAARRQVRVLRLVFSDGPSTRSTLSSLKLENMDTGILGEEFPDEITVSPHVDHFDLMATDRVLRHVDELVAASRVARDRPAGQGGDQVKLPER